MRLPILSIILCMLLPEALFAQPFTKKYIMSFHHCAIPTCGGPQSHTVMLVESDDAEIWTLVPNFPSYQGSVPDVIIRGAKLYIYTPGHVKRYDYLTNSWDASPVTVDITDSLGNKVNFVDPSAYIDDNGKICLFFLNSTGIIGDPAQCPNPPCTAYFDSAIEVAGSDGTQFVKQSGHRITYVTNTNFKPTDPDIFKSGNTFYQYISMGTGTIVYSCSTLHGSYGAVQTLPNAYLTNNNAGVPCGMYDNSNQTYYSYGHRNTANGTEISYAKHGNFALQPAYNTLFTGAGIGLGNVQVASPGICENTFWATAADNPLSNEGIKIFPSPNHGSFMIESRGKIENITIMDMAGKKMNAEIDALSPNSRRVKISGNGLYFVSVQYANHQISYLKTIIQP